MVTQAEVKAVADRRMKPILDTLEAALPAEQFRAMRRIVLNELGHNGLVGDMLALLHGKQPDGTARNGSGRIDTGRKGGAP